MSISRFINPKMRERILRGERMYPCYERHPRAAYIRRVCLSAPPWVDGAEIRRMAHAAREKTALTGVLHVLGHIVPVTHPLVCGLTVPWNLKIIDWRLNQRVGNGLHWAFQQELFDEPEQLSFWRTEEV